jgi:oligosaccharide repeat unit polymerase
MKTNDICKHNNRVSTKLMIISLLLSLVFGILIAVASEIFANYLIVTRMLYGVLSIVAISIIVIQVRMWRWFGLLTPLSWCMVGFLFFLCLTPIVSPSSFFVYSDPNLVTKLVVLILIGMISYTGGFLIKIRIPWRSLHVWLEESISPTKLVNLILLIMTTYLLLALYLARAGNYSFLKFITQNLYAFSSQQDLAQSFGSYYYVIFIYQLLPVAIAAPTVYCLAQNEISYIKRALLLVGLGMMIFSTFAAGTRAVLAFILGGIGIYYIINFLVNRSKAINASIIRAVFTAVIIGILLLGISMVQIVMRQTGGLQELFSNKFDLNYSIQNFVSQATDQNFTLYQVIKAEESGSLNYLNGESYFLTFVAMIPRSIWPQKPGGSEMYLKLSVIDPWHANVNITHSVLGELIYNFSYLSIIPGMFIFGLFAGTFWRIFYRHKHSYRARILYSMTLIPVAFMVRGTFHATFGGILYPFLLTFLILLLAKKDRQYKGF